MPAPAPGLFYRLLSLALYPLWLLHAIRHGYKHGCPAYLRQRCLGFASRGRGQVWVHASSVGEVRAVTPLVHALQGRGESVLFTSFTATGFRAIEKSFGDTLACGVIPIDGWPHCRSFFRRHEIKLGLIMETELWPELLYQARRRDIPLLQINARLSRKSLDTGDLLRGVLRRTLGYFERLLTRSTRDEAALISLGAEPGRIDIVGNLKSHIELPHSPDRLIERDYLVMASSHAGEEQKFLEARPPGLETCLLVLAPRHPDRSASIQTLIERLGLKFAVRSKAQPIEADTEVYLADTLGELKAFMAHARLVVMGGSFDSTGGHNLIEPASLGCAIITGPSDANIIDDINMLGPGDGVLQVENMAACWQAIGDLLQNPGRAQALGREAQARLARQPDVVQQYLEIIEAYL